jgi:choline monooxygenase
MTDTVVPMASTVVSMPATWCTDPDVLLRERAMVFAPHWQYIGSTEAVADPGSYMAADLGGSPIVITRDEGGELNALANVCRHRGHQVAEACGSRRTLQCRYHGWTYRLDGRLHRAPGAEVDADGVQLPRLAVGSVGSMLFACTDPHVLPLAEVLAPFLDLMREASGVDIERLVRRRTIVHVIDANWKVVAENFMECYHCPLVHSQTLPGYGTDDDYIVRTYDALVTHRFDRDRFSWANLFPNTQISVFGNHRALVARALVPDGVARTRATLDYWFDRGVDPPAETAFVDWFEAIVAEDIPLCNSVQVGVGSGLLDAGRLLVTQESGPIWFEGKIADALGEPLFA